MFILFCIPNDAVNAVNAIKFITYIFLPLSYCDLNKLIISVSVIFFLTPGKCVTSVTLKAGMKNCVRILCSICYTHNVLYMFLLSILHTEQHMCGSHMCKEVIT